MTFNPIAAMNVLECRNIITNENPEAMDLGSQTSSISSTFISNLIDQNSKSKDLQNRTTLKT